MTNTLSEPASTQDIYNEALTLGGSTLQAEVAASLGGGIESGIGGGYGQPQSLELAGGVGPAEGLFQLEPQTWTGGAGGGKNGLPGTVSDATWEQQVQGFLNDTGGPGGSNFGAWGPDVGGAYGYSGAPTGGSPVGESIAQHAAAWAAGKGAGVQGTSAVGGASTGGTAATDASLNANPFDLFGIPQTIGGAAASSIWSEVGPFIVKGLLVTAGLGVIVLGLAKMTGAGTKIASAAPAAPELAEAAAA